MVIINKIDMMNNNEQINIIKMNKKVKRLKREIEKL